MLHIEVEATEEGELNDVKRKSIEIVLGFLDAIRRRDRELEIDRLELIGTHRGAVFAVHRPETWEIEGIMRPRVNPPCAWGGQRDDTQRRKARWDRR